MSDPKTHKRIAPISYRPPADWRDELYARQQASGLSMNAFITRALFGAPVSRRSRRPPLETGDLARLLNHAARIHDKLENAGIEAAILDELSVIRSAILTAMGRAP